METKNKAILVMISIIIGTGIIVSGLLLSPLGMVNDQQSSSQPIVTKTISGEHIQSNYLSFFGNISINAPMPESPSTIPVFTGVFRPGDLVDESLGSFIGDGINVPSEEDAPGLALKILEDYGGLPQDAILMGASTSYAEEGNSTTFEMERRYASDTMVSWKRLLDDRYLVGDTDIIRVLLGDNGNPIWVYKEWRTYTYAGDVPVIPVEKAIGKLEEGDTINQYLETREDIRIYNVSLGYYAKGLEDPVVTVEPVWIFFGETASSGVSFKVYARQFANFTATPTTGKIPLTVTFNDTSDASPNQWYWTFGDGTNSTLQNPVHTYTAAGTYNVTLRAWNDLGSDWMEKPGLITVYNPVPPVANFTASPVIGNPPLNVSFTDLSENGPTGWLWTFGDGTNATVQNPVHTYALPGNYTVLLNVTNDDGSNTITKPGYIVITNLPVTTVTPKPTITGPATVTTPVTTSTTHPTPTTTHASLPVWVPVAGIVCAMLATRRVMRPPSGKY